MTNTTYKFMNICQDVVCHDVCISEMEGNLKESGLALRSSFHSSISIGAISEFGSLIICFIY